KVWAALPEAGRKAVRNLLRSEWKYDYVKDEVARALSGLLSTRALDSAALAAAFPDALEPPETWGDGISTAFLREFSESGVDRACLVTNELSAADTRPEVARLADQLGYLFGPYDSYDGVHPPGMKDSWETSQFDQALFDTGGVLREDGTPRPGYQGKGKVLSCAAARPYLEKRVRAKIGGVPYTSWFMDCDAYGQFFDDFSPDHPATQAQDCAARVARMQWIASTFGVPVGSEGGSAQAIVAAHFGHGVLTPALGGWQDKDFDDAHSKWYLGGWWPPEEPTVFFKKTSLKSNFRRASYDPRWRIPLYEAAFHDCYVATHHWGTPSLKFKGLEAVTALLEQLYNVPPLYHFTRKSFARDKAGILAHYKFFSPLHRRLALVPLTEFRWLTPDRLVQRTVFADGTELTANFGDQRWRGEGLDVPAGSIVSRQDAATSSYRPAY
ncbi:MAG: glycoside hydrolase, partial [bacterium]